MGTGGSFLPLSPLWLYLLGISTKNIYEFVRRARFTAFLFRLVFVSEDLQLHSNLSKFSTSAFGS